MRAAKILFRDEEAGILTQHDDSSFTFKYHNNWLDNLIKPSISLTLPKNQAEFSSMFLFPFFYNILPEGSNKKLACLNNRIDEDDYFGLLMEIAKIDTIGAIRVVKIEN
jgi:HipA-like protein